MLPLVARGRSIIRVIIIPFHLKISFKRQSRSNKSTGRAEVLTHDKKSLKMPNG